MNLAESATVAISVLVFPLMLTGCGDDGAAPPIGRPTQAAPGSQSKAAAMPPTETTARTISYRCNSGRAGTIAVDVPDLGNLAHGLNRIQPCEYDKGVSRATVTVMCRSNAVVVHLVAASGQVVQPSNDALCLQ